MAVVMDLDAVVLEVSVSFPLKDCKVGQGRTSVRDDRER